MRLMPVRDRYLNYLHCITFFPSFFLYIISAAEPLHICPTLFIGVFSYRGNIAARRMRRKSWRDNGNISDNWRIQYRADLSSLICRRCMGQYKCRVLRCIVIPRLRFTQGTSTERGILMLKIFLRYSRVESSQTRCSRGSHLCHADLPPRHAPVS